MIRPGGRGRISGNVICLLSLQTNPYTRPQASNSRPISVHYHPKTTQEPWPDIQGKAKPPVPSRPTGQTTPPPRCESPRPHARLLLIQFHWRRPVLAYGFRHCYCSCSLRWCSWLLPRDTSRLDSAWSWPWKPCYSCQAWWPALAVKAGIPHLRGRRRARTP